jgi:hypothetical protein
MASFSITKMLSDGVYKYIVNIIVDKSVYSIITQDTCTSKYFTSRIPKYLTLEVPKESLQEYLDISFTMNCKRGSVKITVGRLLYYSFILCKHKCEDCNKKSVEELFDIADWMVIHETKVFVSDGHICKTYERANMFHDCKAIEREIYDLIINKRLRKTETKTALEEIKLYCTEIPKSEIYLDANYFCTSRENAKYVTKSVVVPDEYFPYVEEVEMDFFVKDKLRDRLSLDASAINTTLLIDYMYNSEFKFVNEVNDFYTVTTAHSVKFIKEYTEDNPPSAGFLYQLSRTV